MSGPYVKIDNISMFYPVKEGLGLFAKERDRKYVKAVNGVSLDIARGEVLGLIGESGAVSLRLGVSSLVSANPPMEMYSSMASRPPRCLGLIRKSSGGLCRSFSKPLRYLFAAEHNRDDPHAPTGITG